MTTHLINKRVAAVFIHGIFGSVASWSCLLGHLSQDSFVSRSVLLRPFQYPSPKYRLNPLRRIPSFTDVADNLRTFLTEDHDLSDSPCIVLIGHSQGGLIIQRFLADAIERGEGRDLARIRGVVLFATPNSGSELFLTVRQLLDRLWHHPQERALRPLQEEIAEVHRVLLPRVIYAHTVSSISCPIRFDAFVGQQDRVVMPHSAKGLFPYTGTLPGDHFSIIQPRSPRDMIITVLIKAVRRALRSLPPDDTVIKTELLSADHHRDVSAVERLQSENFIPQQDVKKKDFRHWLLHYEETFGFPMHVIVAKLDEYVRGFLMFHENNDHNLIVIDYVACDPDPEVHRLLFPKMVDQLKTVARANGIGSFVFEVEDPTGIGDAARKNRAKARIRKFQSYGARIITGLAYLAPDMESFGVAGAEEPFFLMHAAIGAQPVSLRNERVREIVEFMYKTWYRNWFSFRFKDNPQRLDSYVESLFSRVVTAGVPQAHGHALVTLGA